MSAMDTSDVKPAHNAAEEASSLLDKLLDTHISSENIEAICDINKNCETCIILPNTINGSISRNKFTICNPNSKTIKQKNVGDSSRYSRKQKRKFRQNKGGGNCQSSGTCDQKNESGFGRTRIRTREPYPKPKPAPKPKEEDELEEVVDNTEMISLDGIMVIIVDLHGEIILRNPPINTKLIGIKNIASIAAAPAGMCNIISPKDTAEFQERFIRENLKGGIKKMVEKKLTSNLQKIENIAADASAAVGNPKSNVGKNMSSVSPDMCVTLLQDLQNHLKTSNVPLWKTSVDADKILKTTDMQKKAALENPDDRYRSLNIIKGFGVPRVPYTNKSISYNNKDVGVESMGVTTMRFRVNKNNKVTCGTRFIGVDDLFSKIKDKIITPALQESTTYSTTMERLISRVIEIAQEDKLDPESIVVVDLTCSNINDTPLQSKPLATNINSVNMPGGSKKKPKKHKKNTKKIKRRTHIRNRVAS